MALKEAYNIMFDEHPPHLQVQNHPTAMTGQGERMAFVGMLLRTADLICGLKRLKFSPKKFSEMMKELKRYHPEIAHGVAVLNFLMAGLCRNDKSTLQNLSHLVKALKKAGATCNHNDSFTIKLCDIYSKKNKHIPCTMTLILHFFAIAWQCQKPECCKSAHAIARHYVEKLGSYRNPNNWHYCADCESMLVDILMYTYFLSITDRRMLASLRLSLNCVIRRRHNSERLKQLKQFAKDLFSKGFTEIKHCECPSLDNTYLELSLDYEAIFISGWRANKKPDKRILLEEFLREKDRRLFFIQCRYQVKGDEQPEIVQGKQCKCPRCCEPQMMKQLNAVIKKLGAELAPFIKVHMMLEQGPCDKCSNVFMPSILTQLDDHLIPLQLVTMLEYVQYSDLAFLERLTLGCQPVVRLRDLEPSVERHGCIVCGDCRHITCHEHFRSLHSAASLRYPGRYSKPSIALTVDRRKLRHHNRTNVLHTVPHGIMWFHAIMQLHVIGTG